MQRFYRGSHIPSDALYASLPVNMFTRIRQIFRSEPEPPPPAIGPGERVYAIGDVHGCLDLFNVLIAAIEADDAARQPADTTIVLLGDLIDRGPDSAGVLGAARSLAARRKVRIIAGNHEEMLLGSLESIDTLRHFLRFGGRETLQSYPGGIQACQDLALDELQACLDGLIAAEDLAFIRSFEDRFVIGDYLFVHAGIVPDLPLELQKVSDMRWIREPFLSYAGRHGWVVVHGHTIADDVALRTNRIGIDTGAFLTGRLTALGLEGGRRWLMETSRVDGAVCADTRLI